MIKIKLELDKDRTLGYPKFKSFTKKEEMLNREQYLDRNFWMKFAFSAVLNAVFICFVYKIAYVRLVMNDDYAFNLFLSGAYGSQTGYTVFQNIVLGKILAWLYMLIPQINWYTIFLMGTLYSSFVVFDVVIFDKFGKYLGILFQIITSLLFLTVFVLNFQWTLCAYAAIITGLVTMVHGYESTGAKRRFYYEISAFFLILSYMIRANIFFPALVYMLGYTILMLISDKRKAFNLLIFVSAIFVSWVMLKGINTIAYNKDEVWKEYRRYNVVRSELMDYGSMDYDEYIETFKAVGWSKNDKAVFDNFMIPDDEKYSTENLEIICKAKQKDKYNLDFNSIKKHFMWDIHNIDILLAFDVILVVAIIEIVFNKNKIIPIALALSAPCFHIAFIIARRPLFRVVYPHYVLAAMLLIYMIDIKRIKSTIEIKSNKLIIVMILSVLVASTSFFQKDIVDSKENFKSMKDRVEKNQKIKPNAIRKFDEYVRLHQENVYIMCPNSYSSRNLSYSIFYAPKKDSLINFSPFGGWEERSKYNVEFKKKYGIKNTLEDLVKKDNFYIVPFNNKDMLTKYMEENYKYSVKFNEVEDLDGIKVYKVVKVPPKISDKKKEQDKSGNKNENKNELKNKDEDINRSIRENEDESPLKSRETTQRKSKYGPDQKSKSKYKSQDGNKSKSKEEDQSKTKPKNEESDKSKHENIDPSKEKDKNEGDNNSSNKDKEPKESKPGDGDKSTPEPPKEEKPGEPNPGNGN